MPYIKYTQEHEWISMVDDIGTVGISSYAQAQLGDVVFVEVPEVGAIFSKGAEAAVVESVKAASEVYAPVDGEIVATNKALEDDPSTVNSDAEDKGWFFKIKVKNLANLDELMDTSEYEAFLADIE
ncbi:MAG: glycine cleavage system protein GcvH [Rhodospirillales bacterium]|jgi:glycine cleavage system H protein